MHVIDAANVRDALPQAVQYVLAKGTVENTRVGPAYVAPEPVTIHYKNPKQHVLVNPVRDANPFFHLMEAMWMLAGRDDSAFLDHYIKDFGKKFGKDGIVMDAYGQRWRHGMRYDQLHEISNRLRKEPTTRQCVLQMWGAGRDDLRAYSGIPCNLVCTFRIRERGTPVGNLDCLDMTVFNRSNDLIWGCCGANAVHFPLMQEYLAGRIGVEIGEYWQVTTNLHIYTDHTFKMSNKIRSEDTLVAALGDSGNYEETFPLISQPLHFDEDLYDILELIEDIHEDREAYTGDIANPFFYCVVIPMAYAHRMYKKGKWDEAFKAIGAVRAEDWRRAGSEWLVRRKAS